MKRCLLSVDFHGDGLDVRCTFWYNQGELKITRTARFCPRRDRIALFFCFHGEGREEILISEQELKQMQAAVKRVDKIRERHREWQRRNPDRVKLYRDRYVLKQAAKLQEEGRQKSDDA